MCVEQVSVRELNQDTAGVLERVERGEILEITNRGKPVAQIRPIEHGPLDDLVAAGRAIPPSITGPIPAPRLKAPEGEDAGELLSSLRDEERW